MSIEALLIIGCVFGNGESCVTSGQAYYQSTDLPYIVSQFEREHKTAVYTFTLVSTLFERKVTAGIGDNFVASIDFTKGTGVPFLKYTVGF